jgi:hypothetical protein
MENTRDVREVKFKDTTIQVVMIDEGLPTERIRVLIADEPVDFFPNGDVVISGSKAN